MNIEILQIEDISIAELVSEDRVIHTVEDGMDLLGNVCFQGIDKMMIHEKNISPDFFDLKTGMAGELLQKFSNYRVRLAIIGDFRFYTAQSLQDFMLESNKRGHINFVASRPDAIETLLRHH
ncbi:DUF4180 domain-containing protein [Taibaiella sp. KBW10]|uniref:DUF4180 domain-containing protein n=1 Tax=Taibaiella sp. KBW10 TaxID=2153357 RepID=UPI000F5A41C8|nr:DUF4180 domain-containing protein [Taibaiella sp. KBW10]RQO30559.1 DUF4180 domain-containing protein [Taibaiella sp. KBW10]